MARLISELSSKYSNRSDVITISKLCVFSLIFILNYRSVKESFLALYIAHSRHATTHKREYLSDSGDFLSPKHY